MSDQWDQKAFDEFRQLRDGFKESKRTKNHGEVIAMCLAILEIDKRAKFIQILSPLFHKELGNAYMSLKDFPKAAEHFQLAKEGYCEWRRSKGLNQPDDWLKDIGICDKRLAKLQPLLQREVAV